MGVLRFFLVLFFMLVFWQSQGQSPFTTSLGLSWKSDIMNVFSLRRLTDEDSQQGTNHPFSPTGGGAISGFGLSGGVALTKWGLRLEYAPSLLYDMLYYNGFTADEHRKLTVDQHFTFSVIQKVWRIGVGYTVVNDNKTIHYTDPFQTIHQDIEYSTINAVLARQIKDICVVEFKILYSRSGFPNNPDKEIMLYGLRVSHEFKRKR